MDERILKHAKDVYAKVCDCMDAMDLKYTKREEDLIIECSARGEDLPMDLIIRCNTDLQILQIFSNLPVTVPEDKRLDFAIITAVANNKLVNGTFDFDIRDGSILFRMANSFRDVMLGFDTVQYLVYCAFSTIDNYNDKFLMAAKGLLSLEQFLESEA